MSAVAMACRYGHAGLHDVLQISLRTLLMFNDAIQDLIAAENKQRSPTQALHDHMINGG